MLVVAGYYSRDESACSTLKLARPAGVEPATTSLEGWCSIQLSYGRKRTGSRCEGRGPKNNRYITKPRPSHLASRPSALGPFSLVGVEGFEPTTPCSQSRCATRLRYTPIGTHARRRLHGPPLANTRKIDMVRSARGRNYTHRSRKRQSDKPEL